APSRVANMMGSDVQTAVVRDRTARPRWTVVSRGDSLFLRPFQPGDSAAAESADAGAAGLPVSFNIFGRGLPAAIGTLEARLRGSAILESGAANAVGVGAVLAAIDRVTSASLVPVPFDAGLLTTDRFVWAGEEWLAVRSDLDEPRISLVTA